MLISEFIGFLQNKFKKTFKSLGVILKIIRKIIRIHHDYLNSPSSVLPAGQIIPKYFKALFDDPEKRLQILLKSLFNHQ